MTWLTAVIGLLTLGAAARLTRLVTTDSITEPLREAIARRSDNAQLAVHTHRAATQNIPSDEAAHDDARVRSKLARRSGRWQMAVKFTGCDWCVGFWASLLVYGGLFRYNSGGWMWDFGPAQWFLYAITVLAASYAIGLIAEAMPDGHNHPADEPTT